MIGFGRVSVAISGADGGPQSGVIEIENADAGVAGGGGVRAVARGDFGVGGHFARGGKLHGAGEVEPGIMLDVAKGIEDGGQADLGMAIARGDRREIALRAREKRWVDLVSEGGDVRAVL